MNDVTKFFLGGGEVSNTHRPKNVTYLSKVQFFFYTIRFSQYFDSLEVIILCNAGALG